MSLLSWPSTPGRACLVNGGGDTPGVHAVIRGFVDAATRQGVEVLGCLVASPVSENAE
jgi:6-phosphofructokinase